MTPKQMLFRTVELPVPGTLYLHSMPGRFEPFARAAQAIAEYGIARVVCLTPMDEILDKSPEYHRAIATGLPWIHEFCPIRDYGVPGEVQNFSDLARKVADGLQSGERTLIHCAAGIGRTGTFAMVVALKLGLPHADARRVVRAAGASPDTAAQDALVAALLR